MQGLLLALPQTPHVFLGKSFIHSAVPLMQSGDDIYLTSQGNCEDKLINAEVLKFFITWTTF